MKILVSNDDGYSAPGLKALSEALKPLAEVVVVAPDRDRSGASNSLTLTRPLRMTQASNGFFAVDGTPTDCVHLALCGALDFEPDLVVSGINAGANMGDDVIYSGTVAAAMEGRFLGLPAIAVSVADHSPRFFSTAAHVAAELVANLSELSAMSETILNVNVPDISLDELAGYELARLGRRHKAEPVHKMRDPRGRQVYWIGAAGPEADAGPGTDFYAVNNARVAVTPLHSDLTNLRSNEAVGRWISALESV